MVEGSTSFHFIQKMSTRVLKIFQYLTGFDLTFIHITGIYKYNIGLKYYRWPSPQHTRMGQPLGSGFPKKRTFLKILV